MPAPATPPSQQIWQDILTAIQQLQAVVVAQGDDLDKIANYQRFLAESMYGASTSIANIWDGTDRYPEV